MGRCGHLVIVWREKASENTSCTNLSLFWSCFWQDGSCQKEENKDGRHATVGRKKASNNSASTPRCFQVTRGDCQISYFFNRFRSSPCFKHFNYSDKFSIFSILLPSQNSFVLMFCGAPPVILKIWQWDGGRKVPECLTSRYTAPTYRIHFRLICAVHHFILTPTCK